MLQSPTPARSRYQSRKACLPLRASPIDRRRFTRFAGEEFEQNEPYLKFAPCGVASSCPALPDSRKEAPFFFRKSFFHSLGDKCQTAAPSGPSTPPPLHPSTRGVPAPTPAAGESRSRDVMNPLPFPRPQLNQTGTCPKACEAVRRLVRCIYSLSCGRTLRPDCLPACGSRRQDRTARLRAAARKTATEQRHRILKKFWAY
jgi:hypothetical protein